MREAERGGAGEIEKECVGISKRECRSAVSSTGVLESKPTQQKNFVTHTHTHKCARAHTHTQDLLSR
jgi:hypothetical protein